MSEKSGESRYITINGYDYALYRLSENMYAVNVLGGVSSSEEAALNKLRQYIDKHNSERAMGLASNQHHERKGGASQ